MSNYGEIVKGVRECDVRSQMMFYDLFIRPIYLSAYSVTESESEAEEIAQDTMLKVFDRTDLLNDDARAMERIMRRIASNAAIDLIRRRKDFVISVEEFSDTEDGEDGETDSLAYDFSMEDIKEGIETLSVTYRSILLLRLFEEMSFTEIAGMLKINNSTVRVQYTRGIVKLKNALIKKKNYV